MTVPMCDLTGQLAACKICSAENKRLRAALREARDCIESWGAQADAYLQEKHDLAGDLAAIDSALGREV